MTKSLQNTRLDFETYAIGTHNLLETVRKYSQESIVLYSSTKKLYGDLETLHTVRLTLDILVMNLPMILMKILNWTFVHRMAVRKVQQISIYWTIIECLVFER
jgi:hypothetical protein